jgi:beta-mannanase
MALQQSYSGLDNHDLLATESWRCDTADNLAVHTGRANWTDWSSSAQCQIDRTQGTDSELRWSILILANSGTLAAAAAKTEDDKIIVRVGEEFNGNWMPSIAAAKEPDYIQAYRNSVDASRSVSDLFEWNVNAGGTRDRSKRYPADKYVDTVGMDFYWDSKKGITDPLQAFDYYKNTRCGPQWLENFSTPRGKQSAQSEWGVNSPNAN